MPAAHSPEFRRRALIRVSQGNPVAQTARDLGISFSWCSGLGSLSLAMLVAAMLPILGHYSVAALAVSVIGLGSCVLGLHTWFAASTLRKSIAKYRLGGRSVWPIRTQTGSRRYVLGLLEVKPGGLEVRLSSGAAPMDWDDLTKVDLIAPGLVRPARVLLEGRLFGRAEIELLDSNAVTTVDEAGLREFVNLVKNLSLSA